MTYPVPGQKYQHYKGGIYEIVSMAAHTETAEQMVVYKSVNFGTVYVRPYTEWNKPVENLWWHNGDWTRQRFSLIP